MFCICTAKPVLKVRPTNATVYEGESVMLDCAANGDPLPTIQWDKNHVTGSFDMQRFQVMLDCLFMKAFFCIVKAWRAREA